MTEYDVAYYDNDKYIETKVRILTSRFDEYVAQLKARGYTNIHIFYLDIQMYPL